MEKGIYLNMHITKMAFVLNVGEKVLPDTNNVFNVHRIICNMV